MKKVYLIYLVFASLLMQSCNKIDDKLIPIAAKDWYGKRILIEDYTGHRCPNCPAAAIVASDLKALYGDKIVVIAVHAGYFAEPKPLLNFPEDFRTTAGTEWDNFFGISNAGNPNGLINRVGFPTTTHIINPNAWAAKVGSLLTEIPEVEIEITPNFNTSTNILTGQVKTKFLKTIKKKLKLQIVITEDSIIAPQQNASTIVVDYVHRHVLRGALNDSWGSELTNGLANSYIDTEILTPISSFAIDPTKWKTKHCTIVAFVYDDNTKEILQVAEKHIE